jgi:hypothetical protein
MYVIFKGITNKYNASTISLSYPYYLLPNSCLCTLQDLRIFCVASRVLHPAFSSRSHYPAIKLRCLGHRNRHTFSFPSKIYRQIGIPIAACRTNWSPCRLWVIVEACPTVSPCPSRRVFLHRHLFLALGSPAAESHVRKCKFVFMCYHSFQVAVPLVLRYDVWGLSWCIAISSLFAGPCVKVSGFKPLSDQC